MNEFEIIQHYFKRQDEQADASVVLGIGDDAAVLELQSDCQLVLCMDTLVSGVHFPVDTSPADIAYKALAVNLSDMAAMGATPRWITMSLTVPNHDDSWFEAFANSFHHLASSHSLTLVGGDMSRGPLSVTVQLQGTIPSHCQELMLLTRSGARPGDRIYVSGALGAAAYALQVLLKKEKTWPPATEEERLRLLRPLARLELGYRLSGKATSCIDISDGLQADLMHVLVSSEVGAELELDKLPLSTSLQAMSSEAAIELAMTGGDDYELCFTLPAAMPADMLKELNAICPIACIGVINAESGELLLKDASGEPYYLSSQSYRHF